MTVLSPISNHQLQTPTWGGAVGPGGLSRPQHDWQCYRQSRSTSCRPPRGAVGPGASPRPCTS